MLVGVHVFNNIPWIGAFDNLMHVLPNVFFEFFLSSVGIFYCSILKSSRFLSFGFPVHFLGIPFFIPVLLREVVII